MPKRQPSREKCWVCDGQGFQLVWRDSNNENQRIRFGAKGRQEKVKCEACAGKGWRLI